MLLRRAQAYYRIPANLLASPGSPAGGIRRQDHRWMRRLRDNYIVDQGALDGHSLAHRRVRVGGQPFALGSRRWPCMMNVMQAATLSVWWSMPPVLRRSRAQSVAVAIDHRRCHMIVEAIPIVSGREHGAVRPVGFLHHGIDQAWSALTRADGCSRCTPLRTTRETAGRVPCLRPGQRSRYPGCCRAGYLGAPYRSRAEGPTAGP